MEAFEELQQKFATQTEAIVRIATAQVSIAESQGTMGASLTNLGGDLAKLLDIIAGSGPDGLTAEQTAVVSAALTKANDALVPAGEALTANALDLAASARDLAALAEVVPT